jgi:hypothetical protein
MLSTCWCLNLKSTNTWLCFPCPASLSLGSCFLTLLSMLLFAVFSAIARQYQPEGGANTHTYSQVMHCKTNAHANSQAGGIK